MKRALFCGILFAAASGACTGSGDSGQTSTTSAASSGMGTGGAGGSTGTTGTTGTSVTSTSHGATSTTSTATTGTASSSSGMPTGRCNPTGAFGPLTAATELGQGSAGDQGWAPWLTHDETTAYFARYGGVLVATRSGMSGPFGAPTTLTVAPSGHYLTEPSASSDGLTLFFSDTTGAYLPRAAHRASVTAAFGMGQLVTVATEGAAMYRETPNGFYYMGWNGNEYGRLYFADKNGSPATVAYQFAVPRVFHSYAVSADEKTAYVTGTDPISAITQTLRVTRPTLNQPFGQEQIVNELSLGGAGSNSFNVWWVSDDDCLVYGEYFENGPDLTYIYRAMRAQ